LNIVEKIEVRKEDLTPEEFEIYLKYLEGGKFADTINEARKQSLYDLDIDQIKELRKKILDFKKLAEDKKKYYDKQESEFIEEEVKKAKETADPIKD
jgi:hypothetical protein